MKQIEPVDLVVPFSGALFADKPIYDSLYDLICLGSSLAIPCWAHLGAWMFGHSVLKCHEMSWNVMKCHEMSWNVMKCHEMSWNVMKCHEMSWNVERISWISPFFHVNFAVHQASHKHSKPSTLGRDLLQRAMRVAEVAPKSVCQGRPFKTLDSFTLYACKTWYHTHIYNKYNI